PHSSRLPRPPTPTLLPYTTLFRSGHGDALLDAYIDLQGANPYADYRNRALAVLLDAIVRLLPDPAQARLHIVHVVESALNPSPRSEEHTSELQSRVDLVCRLLLEK